MDESFEILIRIRITKHDGDKSCAFGFGTAELLRGVSEHGSLNRAAHEMGMAYSKAWKSLRETEKQLGFSLLDRHGANGSVLTAKAVRFLSVYDKMTAHATQAAKTLLDELAVK